MSEKNDEYKKNLIIESLINYLKDEEVKNNIKDIVKPLLEVILIELYPYIFYFVIILLIHISLTVYIIYMTLKKIEN
jgi:hypothetical protein